MASSPKESPTEIQYTVFVRVPFPRGDFVDPPASNWNAAKDRALWRAISSPPKNGEIDWQAIAEQFDVTLAFLHQQAAWLYERQLSQVREQLRKVNRPTSISASPAPSSFSGSAHVGGQAMKRVGSGESRAPSSLSVRAKDSSNIPGEGSTPGTPVQGKTQLYSRTASASTITQAQRRPSLTQENLKANNAPNRKSIERGRVISDPPTTGEPPQERIRLSSPAARAPSQSSGSSSSSSDVAPLSRSRMFARRPRFSAPKAKAKTKNIGLLAPTDEAASDSESDSHPAFLPFSNPQTHQDPSVQNPQDPSETLRKPLTQPSRPPVESKSSAAVTPPFSHRKKLSENKNIHSSSSSTSLSSAPAPSSSHPSVSSPSAHPSRSSTNALSTLSPHQRRIAKEGSEGTPSMGSSFSDLDDASVTQSALEEALAKEMQQGRGSLGVVSRMGGLWRGSVGGAGTRGV